MSLYDTVSKDITNAMKAKEQAKLDVLRMLKAALLNNKTAAKPLDEVQVLVAHAKKLKDSLELFPAGGSEQQKINEELKFLEPYLPAQLSEVEVKKIIADIIAANPGVNMGGVMKDLTPQIKGKFDGKTANDLVKAALA
ncbi:MAG: GatB/YqeY domain-containing protein [Bacteriovoracaceae bacterium]